MFLENAALSKDQADSAARSTEAPLQTLHLGRLKKDLLKFVQEAGATVIFSTTPIGIIVHTAEGISAGSRKSAERVAGIVAATKDGLIAIPGNSVIDCTRNAVLGAGKILLRKGRVEVRRVAEFLRVESGAISKRC